MKTPWRRYRLFFPDKSSQPPVIFRPREAESHDAARDAALRADKVVRLRLGVAIGALVVFVMAIVFGLRGFETEPARPVVIVNGPDYDKRPIPAAPANSPAPSGTSSKSDTASETASPSSIPENATAPKAPCDNGEHDLCLLPNLFGGGMAVSDGRVYSVALIASHGPHIPPRTPLFAQGKLIRFYASYGNGYAEIQDEEVTDASLLCAMTDSEFEDARYLYHVGEIVQVGGDYTAPVFRNCRMDGGVSSDRIVRPVEPAKAMTNMGNGAHRQEAAPLGTHHFVVGVLRNVHCDNPTMSLNVVSGATVLKLYTTNYFSVAYSVLDVTLNRNLNPCADLEGRSAKVEYVYSQDESTVSFVVGIELHQ